MTRLILYMFYYLHSIQPGDVQGHDCNAGCILSVLSGLTWNKCLCQSELEMRLWLIVAIMCPSPAPVVPCPFMVIVEMSDSRCGVEP